MLISVWHWYSGDQLFSAIHFADLAKTIEASPPEASEEEKARGLTVSTQAKLRHRSFVIASVLASAAFVEAVINEVILSAAHDNLQVGGQLSCAERGKLTAMADSLDRLPMLDRSQMVLHLLDRQPFDRGIAPYQDVHLLTRLRNALVHYKTRWRDAGGAEVSAADAFEAALKSKGFSLNPFTGAGNPFFPDHCLSAGCASWAHLGARQFADDLHERLGVEPTYLRVFEDLP